MCWCCFVYHHDRQLSLSYRQVGRPDYRAGWANNVESSLTNLGYQPQVINLIKGMLEPNILKRLGPAEAAAAWQKISPPITNATTAAKPREAKPSFDIIKDYFIDCDKRTAEIFLNNIIINPEIDDKSYFILGKSSQKGFYNLSTVFTDHDKGKFAVQHVLVKIDNQAKMVNFYDEKGKQVNNQLSFETISQAGWKSFKKEFMPS